MTHPKRVALAVTCSNDPFYDDDSCTGAYFSEIYHPWKVYTDAGFIVDIVSENGQFAYDSNSIQEPAITKQELEIKNDPSSAYNKDIGKIQKAEDVNANDYGIFYAAGGHGTVYDFNGNAPNVAKLAGQIYDNGGIVSAVCHGPIILAFAKDKYGNVIIKDKKVTGFPDIAEEKFGLVPTLKKRNVVTVHDVIDKVGEWVEPGDPFEDFTVSDGRILTGANPASAASLAKHTIDFLK